LTDESRKKEKDTTVSTNRLNKWERITYLILGYGMFVVSIKLLIDSGGWIGDWVLLAISGYFLIRGFVGRQ